jgi:phage baseplate assembly protein W
MAFGAVKIPPINTKPSIAIGVSIPFDGNAVFNSTYTTQDATRNNLINFLLTNPGERYFSVGYGAGLRRYIFDQINRQNFDFLEADIQSKIASYFPNVTVTSINISADPDRNQVFISINYTIKDFNINDELNVAFTTTD